MNKTFCDICEKEALAPVQGDLLSLTMQSGRRMTLSFVLSAVDGYPIHAHRSCMSRLVIDSLKRQYGDLGFREFLEGERNEDSTSAAD